MRRKPFFRGKRRFRRKGNRGVWFPVNGDLWVGELANYYDATANASLIDVPLDRATGPLNVVFPVTEDYNQQPQNVTDTLTAPSLRDFVEGQSYLLKALVGNLFIYAHPGGGGTAANWDPSNWWSFVQATAGFFVARAQDGNTSVPDLSQSEVDPLNGNNIQNPWIWRRMWILQNPFAGFIQNFDSGVVGTTLQRPTYTGFTSNVEMSAENGPFFRTKSARRIRREERLWCSISVLGWDGNRQAVNGSASGIQPGIDFSLDLRIFGKMVRAKNTSSF